MNRPLIFYFTGYSGLSVVYSILPERWQARIIAKKWLRSLRPIVPDLTITELVVQMPTASYRVVSLKGAVEPCEKIRIPFV